jgi:fatty-acyl-CoA synthase
MRGLMMDAPLLITSIMQHGARYNGDAEVVSVTADNPRHRYTYGAAFERAARLAHALTRLGMRRGDRIGTLAWNDHRHFEIYYAVSCAGAVCHTINPRLFEEQISYIVNHAEDRILLIDPMFVPLIEKLAGAIRGVEAIVVMTDAAHMPESLLPNVRCYETLLEAERPDFDWPQLDEYTASSLCYTSGTTGHPKGVLYSHRSTLLHALSCIAPDVMGVSMRDAILPVVPMFHVNAWGTPYSAPMIGAKLVLPGAKMGDPETLQTLIESEGVTFALGVPTIWMGLLAYLQRTGKRLGRLERTIVGGACCPPSMIHEFHDTYGVTVCHGWGMTEMSPVGTAGGLTRQMHEWSAERQLAVRAKQGRPIFGVQMKIVDEEGRELPWDGQSAGALLVRGPTICSEYYRADDATASHDAEGWFRTGDVGTIDASGYLQITDRTKDVIKSGGEWISSIELENTALAHPAVAEAAVIAVPHPRWQERPLLVAVLNDGANLTRDELLGWFRGRVASWWIPDDVVFVEEIPHTATGKISKLTLRQQFGDFGLAETG